MISIMKKTILMALLLSAGSMAAMADDYKYLTVATNSAEESIELATIQKITFEGKNVVVTTSAGQATFPQSEMQKMFFSATATAIEAMPQQSESLKVAQGVLSVKGNGMVHIYSSNGALQRLAKVEGDAKISLNNLPKGVYIISMGNQTIKVSK